MKQSSIVVTIPLEEELLIPLHEWGKKFDFSSFTDLYFIHVVKKIITPLEFGMMETPDEKTFQEMKPTFEKFLRDHALKIIPPSFKGNTHFYVTADLHPRENVVEHLKQKQAQLVVVSTRGRKGFPGLFRSSFAEYLVKFSPCDVYVVRPQK